MMINEPLLTKRDLAEHWQVSTKTIETYISDGIVTPVRSIPSIRFNPEDIRKLDGTHLEKFSPLERRRMERRIEELEAKLSRAEGALVQIQSIVNGFMYITTTGTK